MSTRHGVPILFLIATLTTVPLVLAGEQQDPGPCPETTPIGKLGHPLGHYLKIEGIRAEEGKVGVCTLLVDTVNGQKLKKPVEIWIENVKLLEGRRCVLKGYESCRMIGLPPALEAAARESGEKVNQVQAAWQMRFYFVATSVVSPNDLRITKDGRKS